MAALPLIKELQMPLTPPEIYRRLDRGGVGFILESALTGGKLGRYSFVGCDPFATFRSKGRQAVIRTAPGPSLSSVRPAEEVTGNPFEILRELLDRYRMEGIPGLPPFWGGAAGYFAYDLGEHLEELPSRSSDDLGLPDCYLGFYDAVVAIDHLAGKTFLISTGLPERGEAGWRRAAERLRELEARLAAAPGSPGASCAGASRVSEVPVGPSITSNFTREAYCRAVARAKEYIAAGDIFQVNLSQRLSTGLTLPAFDLYRRLRQVNPAPFAAYLSFPEVQVVSASPERFLKLTGGQVETRPIKGTRPRGRDPESDRALREELLASEKDRAELVMIIDLERNDLGRVCEYGSVKVPELMALEEYATVFHLVSTVTGTMRPGLDVIDLLKASFPGGSITGAPKIRAMEIIDELEGVKRGIYTGSIGWIGFDGDADQNIVIRTFVIQGHRAYFQVGGGIVADSDPEAEYRETLDKARGLVRALGLSDEDGENVGKEPVGDEQEARHGGVGLR